MASPDIRMHPRHEKHNRAKAGFLDRIIAKLPFYTHRAYQDGL